MRLFIAILASIYLCACDEYAVSYEQLYTGFNGPQHPDTFVFGSADSVTISYLYEADSFIPLAQVHSEIPASHYDPLEVRARQETEKQRQQHAETEQENLKWLQVTDAKAYELAANTIAERQEKEQQATIAEEERQGQHDWIYFVNTDHLGTPQEMVSEDGNVVWLARYKAWGGIHRLEQEAIKQPLRFQGQYFDEETGLHYNRHRYYDPDSARFLTQDSIKLLGGNNLYLYAPNSVLWVDPLGLVGAPLDDETQVNRIGGNSVENLRLKDAEKKLTPPGISVLHSCSSDAASQQMREAFPKATGLQKAAGTVSSGTANDIRAAGFDVVSDPTNKFPNHARIVHPDGAAGFTDENLSGLSQALGTTTTLP